MKPITQAYIMGIKEGRALLTACPGLDRVEILDILDNITSTLKRGFSGDVADMLRGERDFWKNQLKEGVKPCTLTNA
jgi:hypothetical protein